MKLNKIVRELYQKSGMNQKEFAEKYKISYSTLNHILTSENRCGIDFFEKLLKNMKLTYEIKIYEK